MKINGNAMRFAAVAAVAFAAGRFVTIPGSASVASGQDPHAPEALTPEMQAMIAVGAPGRHHRHLDQLVGTWTGEFTMRMAPDAPAMTTTGTVERAWILDGRFLEERVTAGDVEERFHGIGYLGFNNLDGRYEGVWMDDTSTVLHFQTGTMHEDENVMHMRGNHRDPISGRVINSWGKTDFEDPNRHVHIGYSTDEHGKTYVAMEGVMVREK